jgi:hypothetical protein
VSGLRQSQREPEPFGPRPPDDRNVHGGTA